MSKVIRQNTAIDAVICAEYEEFGTPADKILIEEDRSKEFAARVNAKLPASSKVDLTSLKRRLLNLRKLGQDRGGLPRLQRTYQGRKTKPQSAVKPR